jgi:hypothetical protein
MPHLSCLIFSFVGLQSSAFEFFAKKDKALFEQSHSTLYGSPDIDIFPVTYLDYFVFV